MKEKIRVKRMFVLNGGSFLYETGMMLMGKNLAEFIPDQLKKLAVMLKVDTEGKSLAQIAKTGRYHIYGQAFAFL